MSDTSIGIALLSFAHVHASGYADAVHESPDCKVVAIWDEDEGRGRIEADRRGTTFVAELNDVLALPDVEAVVVNAPTAMHKEILIAAANAGKHIFTEKSLTINTEDATQVMRAVETSGVRFMISLPSRTRPENLFAKRLLDEGNLGEVTLMRARIAHSAALDRWFHDGTDWFGDEAQAGGGAFFDLGCHRVDLMRWFLGEPISVVAQKTNHSGAYNIDDNMVAVVTFRNKAVGVIDVSWVQRQGPNPLEIYGTDGYLSIDGSPLGPRIQLASSRISMGDITGYVSPTRLPPALPSPMQQWISSIKDGTVATISIYDGWNLVQLMEACYRSAREGREITL
ncbi:MAG: Gfo/Idh/MocA family oxidoreductase [Armatimonadetes bacterium]|nr:Gfo/Idh/MocA family oxidoreductase [Armatimonadota bacterium]MDE2205404.1 Gfo/Idh/MocA family oxidoreductase [Armatimonadota bacterium]